MNVPHFYYQDMCFRYHATLHNQWYTRGTFQNYILWWKKLRSRNARQKIYWSTDILKVKKYKLWRDIEIDGNWLPLNNKLILIMLTIPIISYLWCHCENVIGLQWLTRSPFIRAVLYKNSWPLKIKIIIDIIMLKF